MRIELEIAGYDVLFVSINVPDEPGIETQEKLVDRCSFPLLQDNPSLNIWERMGGGKDDFYILDRDGNVARYFDYGVSSLPLNLSTVDGYATIKDAIIEVIEGVERAEAPIDEPDARESERETDSTDTSSRAERAEDVTIAVDDDATPTPGVEDAGDTSEANPEG